MSRRRRIVIDTNVLISYLLNRHSTPGNAVRHVLRNDHILFSDATYAELTEKTSLPKFARYFTSEERSMFLLLLERVGEFTSVSETVKACRDPSDDKFLALALSGRAETIVTGDKDLLELHPFRGVRIITAGRFLDSL